LNRPELLERRAQRLETLQYLDKLAAIPGVPDPFRAEARAFVLASTTPEAEYSHMCRCAFPKDAPAPRA